MAKKKQSAAPLVHDVPPQVHHHPRSYAPEILTGFICALFGIWILWSLTIYVIGEMGFRNPVAQIGRGIAWIGILLFVFFVIGGWASKIIAHYLDTRVQIKQITLEAQTQIERYRLLAAQSIPVTDGGALGLDQRKADIIQYVMAKAFQFYDQEEGGRRYTRQDPCPWARRNIAGEIVNDKKVTETEAGKVRDWLEEFELIKGDQINTDRYPDYLVVTRFLRREFGTRILVGGGVRPTNPTQ